MRIADRRRLGKTVIFSEIARLAAAKEKSSVIIVHREELQQQAAKKCEQAGVSNVRIEMVQTLANKIDSVEKPSIVIVDECAHAVAGSYKKIFSAWMDVYILGFTATPERLDGKGLGEVFDGIVLGPTVRNLQDMWHLCRTRYFAPPGIDTEELHVRAGEYAADECEKALKPKIVGDCIEHYKRICDGARAVAFLPTVESAQSVATQFRAAGIEADSIDGKLHTDERKRRLDSFRRGEIKVLTNCMLINEGLDIPSIEAAILLRPTKSLALHLQQIGRALRPSPGKTHAIILDHVGNIGRHGFAEDDRAWSLAGKQERQKAELEPGINISTCHRCFASFVGVICPECQTARRMKTRAEIKREDGELRELEARQRVAATSERKHATSYADLVEIAKKRGYKSPHFWAQRVLDGRSRRA